MDFEFSKNAEEDLDNILDYFINKLFNKKAAIDFYNKVCDVINNIKKFPEMYEIVQNDFEDFVNIRRAPISSFNLYYRVDQETKKIVIFRIIYAHYNFEHNKNT